MGARSRLRTRISVVVAVGALLVAAGVALLLINTSELRSSGESTTRGDAYLLGVVNLERLVVDAETGLRGEVITGRTLFLAPLYAAQAQLPGAITQLQRAAAQDHSDQPRSALLIADVRAYMSGYVPRVLALAAHDLSAARTFAVTLEGKQRVDAIRARVSQLERLLATVQARQQRAARSTADRSIADAIIVLVLLTVLTAALGGYLGHLAVERDRAREQSERAFRTLQQSILPPAIPPIPWCEIAARFIPGGEAVSGDFYDVIELAPDRWALIIGDVCGKGAAAAAATAMARWTLRSSLVQGAAPAEALRFLNDVLLERGRDARLITAACLTFDLEPESARVQVACAGHPAPILVPAVGSPAAVEAEGDLLGMEPIIRLHPAELELRPGDSLVAYTDGVTDQGPEARRAPEQALRDQAGADAESLAESLEDLAHQPTGRHPDDIAIVAVRFLGQTGGKPSADDGEQVAASRRAPRSVLYTGPGGPTNTPWA